MNANRFFRLSVPDEWYRRSASKTHSLSSSLFDDDGDTTIKSRLCDDNHDEDEDEGTAKAGVKYPPSAETSASTSASPTRSAGTDTSKNRLSISSMFDGWLNNPSQVSQSTPTISPSREDRRKSVSEPVLVDSGILRFKSEPNVGLGPGVSEASAQEGEEDDSDMAVDSVDFEKMMDELGLKGPQRQAMHQLPTNRKKYLLRQNRHFRLASGSRPPSGLSGSPSRSPTAASSQTYGPASAGQLLPRLVPQLTGDSIMKRFSIAAWGSGGSSTMTPAPEVKEPVTDAEVAPMAPQTTGGLWSSWWASSGGGKDAKDKSASEKGKGKVDDPEWYVDEMRNG